MYRNTVSQIASLPWSSISQQALLRLMVLSLISAREFAESLRLALTLYPDQQGLIRMAGEELMTHTLQYEDYEGPGDHADFLEHFLAKSAPEMLEDQELIAARDKYLGAVGGLAPEIRAMSVFSREAELPEIFTEILGAPDWQHPALEAYRYFLEIHIALDSAEGDGHAALVADHPVTEAVAPFWEARLRLYRPLFA